MNRLIQGIRKNLPTKKVDKLRHIFSNENFNFLQNYNNQFDNLKPEATGYIKQPIYYEDSFELFYIKWSHMINTSIHSHNSHCLFKILSGELDENIYSSYLDSYNLSLSKTLKTGDISYMNHNLGFHEVINKKKRDAYSIHLYIN